MVPVHGTKKPTNPSYTTQELAWQSKKDKGENVDENQDEWNDKKAVWAMAIFLFCLFA